MKRVVVTGGAGFIGSNLTDELINQGYKVTIIDNLSTGKQENINSKAIFEYSDINLVDYDKLVDLLKGVDTIFHCAAFPRVQPSILDPLTSNKANVDVTLKLLMAARDAKVRRVVYSASSSAYGDTDIIPTYEEVKTNPMSPYGLQKLIGEEYCRLFYMLYGLETVSLRYFNVYGERMATEGAYCTVMGIFANQLLNNQPVTITNDGEQRRDFTYVKDVVQANILAMISEQAGKGEVYNIGAGNNYSVNEVADMMEGEKVYGEKRIEPYLTLADNSKAKKILGWNPQGDLAKWILKYRKDLGI
jgi:nucleoside-diphosphate-sugar epimerase